MVAWRKAGCNGEVREATAYRALSARVNPFERELVQVFDALTVFEWKGYR
jgi:hypothetical protein